MHIWRFLLLSLVIFGDFRGKPGLASESIQIAFEDLPKLVREQNLHVRGASRAVQASEARTGHLLRSYLPSLRVEGGGESFFTGPYGFSNQPFGFVGTEINLFRGGRDVLEENVRKNQVRLSEAEKQQTFFNELTEARKAYWQLAYQKEVLGLLRMAIEQNQRNMTAAQKRIRGGVATETDRLEFEINEVQLSQDNGRLQQENLNSQRRLNALLGLPLDSKIEISSQISHEHDDDLLSSQLNSETHRDVVSLSLSSEIADFQKRQAFRWWTPSLDTFANYSLYTLREREFFSLQDRDEGLVGIRISFNLFDRLNSNSEGSSLAFKSESFGDQAQQTSRELAAEFENAKKQLQLIHTLIHEGEKNVEKGKQYLDRTLSEYARGVKNSPDVLGATQKYIGFRRRYAELRLDYQLARANLLAILAQ